MGTDLVAAARELAASAHAGQVDKAGAPYLSHPERVAARVAAQVPSGPAEAVAVAWLHDVVEDTSVTAEELRAAGFPERVVAAVLALTRVPGEEPDTYYARVAADPLALRVKRADIADNTDPARVAALDGATRERLAAKYAHALAVLDELSARRGPGDSPTPSAARD
ncbi:HD domain-containing protein [Kineococcus xinjiangensis]|uniref:HD domain-containing protein n=1 Tax=Kineococcus xinjiangensis TaxID=512762 RepID=A0A2S6IEN4_9ACTN|nr:HD domain-containing protein [Kineococcus xinjiangensis]PPK92646.1 HD domain-containing protein [Kineococcus xinjiangensis]